MGALYSFYKMEKKTLLFCYQKNRNHIYIYILIYCCPPKSIPGDKTVQTTNYFFFFLYNVGFMSDFISFFFPTTSNLRNKVLTWIQDNQLTINSSFMLK